MNTAHHRREIETAIAKLFADWHAADARSTARDAIVKIAAAVQAIMLEIELSRSR